MTIEEILNPDTPHLVEQLEKATNEEILQWFSESLKVTRPELAEKPTTKSTSRSVANTTITKEKQEKLQRARAVAKQFGLELGL